MTASLLAYALTLGVAIAMWRRQVRRDTAAARQEAVARAEAAARRLADATLQMQADLLALAAALDAAEAEIVEWREIARAWMVRSADRLRTEQTTVAPALTLVRSA